MREHYDIHKAAGIIVRDGRQLLVRSKDKEHFVEPGGKLLEGETPKQALIRELKEELGIEVDQDDLEEFDTFYDDAAGQEHRRLKMDVFRVIKWSGEIALDSEIEEAIWVGTVIPKKIKIGSIFEHEIHPRLVKQDELND